MRKLSVRQASRPLGQYASELGSDIVIVTRGRRALAALVPLENVDRESLVLSGHPEFLQLVRRARAEIASGRTLSLEQMKSRTSRKSPRGERKPATRKKRRG